MTPRKPVVVAGDGWSALAAVGFLAAGGTEVRWIAGNGSRVLSPSPGFRAGAAAGGWRALAEGLGLELGDAEEGSFLREFRGKGFRQLDDQSGSRPGSRSGSKTLAELWAPERRFVPGSADAPGCRFTLSAAEIEEQVRARLTSGEFKCLRRVQGLELSAVRNEGGALRAVVLASGEEIECERLIFADRWSGLGAIQGIPKAPSFARKREPVGVLQATFVHEPSLGTEFAELREGFFGPLQREAGEELERHVWGYFSSGESGDLRSFWTICLAPDEAEDNHEIAKRLRRLKSALGKMFAGVPGSSGANDFLASVRDEQVRFAESLIFAGGEPLSEALTLPSCPGVEFVTDGYGPSAAVIPVMKLLGIEAASEGIGDAQGAHAQAENADRAGASAQN